MEYYQLTHNASALEAARRLGGFLVDQAPRHATVGGIIAGDVAEHGFSSLKAPIVQVNARDATVPYSEPLEAFVIPDEERIIAGVRKVLQGRR